MRTRRPCSHSRIMNSASLLSGPELHRPFVPPNAMIVSLFASRHTYTAAPWLPARRHSSPAHWSSVITTLVSAGTGPSYENRRDRSWHLGPVRRRPFVRFKRNVPRRVVRPGQAHDSFVSSEHIPSRLLRRRAFRCEVPSHIKPVGTLAACHVPHQPRAVLQGNDPTLVSYGIAESAIAIVSRSQERHVRRHAPERYGYIGVATPREGLCRLRLAAIRPLPSCYGRRCPESDSCPDLRAGTRRFPGR